MKLDFITIIYNIENKRVRSHLLPCLGEERESGCFAGRTVTEGRSWMKTAGFGLVSFEILDFDLSSLDQILTFCRSCYESSGFDIYLSIDKRIFHLDGSSERTKTFAFLALLLSFY